MADRPDRPERPDRPDRPERPDQPELDAALRSIAADLDRRSRVVMPDAVRARSSHGAAVPGPARRRLVAAGGLAAAAVLVVAAVVVLDDEPDEPVTAGPSPTTTMPGLANPMLPGALGGASMGLAVLRPNSDVLDVLTMEGSPPVLRRVGQAPITDEVLYGSTYLLNLGVGATGGEVSPWTDPNEVPEGCDGAVGLNDVVVAWCGHEPGGANRLVRFDGVGSSVDLVGMPPGNVMGSWRTVTAPWNGATLLAQWSGECEVPSAWFVSPINGAIEPVLPGQPDAEVVGLGWMVDGRAVVHVRTPGCGVESELPGVYVVDPARVQPIELLLPLAEPSSVYLWYRASGPVPADDQNEFVAAQDLADRLAAFARAPSAARLDELPFADEVMLGVGPEVRVRVARDELLDPATWVLPLDNHAARAGDASALELLADHDGPLLAQLRSHGCAFDSAWPMPTELDGYEQFVIEPAEVPMETCINWFGVSVFQHPVTGEIAGITIELWEP